MKNCGKVKTKPKLRVQECCAGVMARKGLT